MTNYDFKCLSDIEFEELCNDILSQHTGLDFISFPKGRDQGIDLLFQAGGRDHVAQVKHYCNSTLSDLKTTMTKESKKMDILKPEKYILMTSLSLTLKNRKEIISIVNKNHLHMKSVDEIYDLTRLNALLKTKSYSWIENKYYKLWLSSTIVMQRLLTNAQMNNISALLKDILDASHVYVFTETYTEAVNLLNEQHMILIHGEPGVGKSTLAKMLILKYIENNYQLKFVSGNNLDKLEDILSPDEESNEIVFIDDFLGANFLELMTQNSDSKLSFFLKRYMLLPNKRVVLTTRTSIYNKALRTFESFNRVNTKLSKLSLEIKSLSSLERAKILYNHCYFRIESKEYFKQLTLEKRYMNIIFHPNYNPRLIEFVTEEARIADHDVKDYYKFVENTLNNPSEVWKYEYQIKIGDEERFIVDTLFSLKGNTLLQNLENAFDVRYEYEIANNSIQRKPDAFQTALSVLSNSFVKLSYESRPPHKAIVMFINPSVSDFLYHYFKQNHAEQKRIIASIKYTDQLEIFGFLQKHKNRSYDYLITNDRVINELRHSFLKRIHEIDQISETKLEALVHFITRYFPHDSDLLDLEYHLIKEYLRDSLMITSVSVFRALTDVMTHRNKDSKIAVYILDNLESVLERLLTYSSDLSEIATIADGIENLDASRLLSFFYSDDTENTIVSILENEIEIHISDVVIDNLDIDDYIEDTEEDEYPAFDRDQITADIQDAVDERIDELENEILAFIAERIDAPKKYISGILHMVDYDIDSPADEVISRFEDESTRISTPKISRPDIPVTGDSGIITDMFENRTYRKS